MFGLLRISSVSALAALLFSSLWHAQILAEEPVAPAVENRQPAPEADEGTLFTRLVRDDNDQPRSLDTSIVRYQKKPDDEVFVDLIGAIHIGDQNYYEELNERFEQYDALLYELVAPQGSRVPKGGKSNLSGVGQLQSGLKDLLGLEYQLEQIDYTKENFVHADMSPEQFSKTMEARGEDAVSLIARMLAQGIVQQSRSKGHNQDLNLLAAFLSPNRELLLRRAMAEQFDDIGQSMVAFEGPEGSTLIAERNKVCLEVLDQQLQSGTKKIGVFYGAGHMADMERRLKEQFGLLPGKQEWIVAWDLRDDVERDEDDAGADDTETSGE